MNDLLRLLIALIFRWILGLFIDVNALPPLHGKLRKGIHCRFWTATTKTLANLVGLGAFYVRSPVPIEIWGAGLESQFVTWLAAVKAAGARPICITSLGKTQPASDAITAKDAADLATFYAGLAKKYPGCVWEIGNEPNVQSTANSPISPSVYGAYLVTLSAAIRAADPMATIISAGIGLDDLPYIRAAVVTSAIDAFGVHTYGIDPKNYESIIAPLETLFGKDAWMTEVGSTTDQVNTITNMFAGARGVFPVAVWFQADDDSDGAFGIMASDGTPKPAYATFAGVAAVA